MNKFDKAAERFRSAPKPRMEYRAPPRLPVIYLYPSQIEAALDAGYLWREPGIGDRVILHCPWMPYCEARPVQLIPRG